LNSRIELAIRLFLGAVFMVAAYNKILAPDHFAKIIYGYYLFPEYTINLIAIILPFFEFFSGSALVLGIYPRSAALMINGLLLTFIIAISINLARGHEFDCGCFSFGEPGYVYSAKSLLIRDIILFSAGIYLILFRQPRQWCIRQTGGLFHP
jgi:putative oxidoreductase